jgi:hypothetical protein
MEGDRRAFPQVNHPGGPINCHDIIPHDADVGLCTKKCAEGPGDIAWRQRCSCDLIEQWLKDMVICAVDEDDIFMTQGTCCCQTTEPTSDNHDLLLCHFAALQERVSRWFVIQCARLYWTSGHYIGEWE